MSSIARPIRRRGQVAVLTAISLTTLMGFGALAVDLGYGYAVKADLQNAADSAALAGVSMLIDSDMLLSGYDPTSSIVAEAQAMGAQALSSANLADGAAVQICSADITIGGLIDPTNASEAINVNAAAWNTVEVTVRRDANCNGEIDTFFANIFGFSSVPVTAAATAFVSDKFSGFHPQSSGTGPLTPFAISKTFYEQQLASGPDSWSWDPVSETPQPSPDGIGEIWIFPSSNSNGNGNFGTLNIGIGNVGTTELGGQIQNGLTEQDLIDEIGTPQIEFTDGNGTPQSHIMTGTPGISAGMTSYVQARVGDIIGFFIHEGVTMSGSNAQFTITDIRFGRLMEIDLTGSPADKRIVIQPIVYGGPGFITDPQAHSSGSMILSMMIIR